MSPISDIGAFRTGRWKLDWFLEAVRLGVEWAIDNRAAFDFLGHPSCLYVADPEFKADRPDLRSGPQGRRSGRHRRPGSNRRTSLVIKSHRPLGAWSRPMAVNCPPSCAARQVPSAASGTQPVHMPVRSDSEKCLRHSGTYALVAADLDLLALARSTTPSGDTRTTIVALRPQQQIVFNSASESAQASSAALPGNSSPRKSVRSP